MNSELCLKLFVYSAQSNLTAYLFATHKVRHARRIYFKGYLILHTTMNKSWILGNSIIPSFADIYDLWSMLNVFNSWSDRRLILIMPLICGNWSVNFVNFHSTSSPSAQFPLQWVSENDNSTKFDILTVCSREVTPAARGVVDAAVGALSMK